MAKRIGTTQRKTRHKLAHKSYRAKGKISLSLYFQQFQTGDIVSLKTYPNVQEGRFHSRFHGFTGKVTGKKGSCYEVKINDGDKAKTVYVHPIHLKRQ